jgi:hypothetical protein
MVEGEGAALWSRVGDLVIECAEWESGEREGTVLAKTLMHQEDVRSLTLWVVVVLWL